MKLSKQDFQTISKALINSKTRIPCKGIWKVLQSELGLSEPIQNNQLTLTRDDIKLIRQFVKNHTGFDPLTENISGTRTEIARKTKDEKAFAESPFASHLLVATRSRLGIPLKSGTLQCPNNVFIGIDTHQLDLEAIDSLLLIENGDTFTQWAQMDLPDVSNDAIFIYRGHGTNQTRLKSLLNNLPANAEIIGFLDADPSGIRLLEEYNVHCAIVPDFLIYPDLAPKSFIKQFSKQTEFEKQIHKLGRNYQPSTFSLQRLYQCITENLWAFTQESLIANNIPLVKIQLFE